MIMNGDGFESRARDALLGAMLPAPSAELPAASELDLGAFWERFEASAPAALQLGFRAATVAVGGLPWLLGYGRSFADLDAEAREAVLVRASTLPAFDVLLDVAKVVVCFAYFADPAVESTIRGRP